MTALVTEHLPLVAGAPEGIRKLRGLILDLAVCGKLVRQDLADEPANRLLQRIAAEKNRLIAAGQLKKQKSLAPLAANEVSIEVPKGWALARLGELVNISTGKLDANAAVVDGAYPFFTCSQTPLRIDTYSYDTSAVLLAGNGDFNLKRYSGQFDVYQRTYVIEPVLWSVDFCFIVLSAEIDRITENNRDSAIPYLKLGDITNPFIRTPPLAEQHRIVAKVDELMALCDRLEADQADAEAAHAQLVQALLGSLTQATDAADFRAHWQRLSEHFHTLFTTEASIDALKQTVLQLAVMGKLVPQDPTDESAAELLGRIKPNAKGVVIAESAIAPLEAGDGQPMLLPAGWSWASFGGICAIKSDLVRPEDFMESQQLAPDCIEKGTGRIIEHRTVRQSGVRGPNSRFVAGQIVYSKIRPSLSKAVLVDFDGLCSADMYPIDSFISPSYQLRLMLSEVFLRQVRLAENRVKMPKLNQESLNSFVLPIPPLAEQHRIVAKVDELMALCDQLKAQLADARQQHAQLATVLIEQAVA